MYIFSHKKIKAHNKMRELHYNLHLHYLKWSKKVNNKSCKCISKNACMLCPYKCKAQDMHGGKCKFECKKMSIIYTYTTLHSMLHDHLHLHTQHSYILMLARSWFFLELLCLGLNFFLFKTLLILSPMNIYFKWNMLILDPSQIFLTNSFEFDECNFDKTFQFWF